MQKLAICLQSKSLKPDFGAALPAKPIALSCRIHLEMWPISKGFKVQHLSNTWVGKTCQRLLLDASYFIDSARQQAAELEAVLTPVENTLQTAARFF